MSPWLFLAVVCCVCSTFILSGAFPVYVVVQGSLFLCCVIVHSIFPPPPQGRWVQVLFVGDLHPLRVQPVSVDGGRDRFLPDQKGVKEDGRADAAVTTNCCRSVAVSTRSWLRTGNKDVFFVILFRDCI